MSYCNGTSWVDIGTPGGDGAGNADPTWLQTDQNWISIGTQDALIDGSYIISISYSGAYLSIIDITAPETPFIAGSVQDKAILKRAQAVAVDGNYAYVTTRGNYDLVVIDISDKSSPSIVANVLHNTGQISAPQDITVANNTVVITSGGASGVYLFDVTDPTSPVSGARMNSPSTISNSSALESNGGTHVFFKGNGTNFVSLDISNINGPFVADSISIAGLVYAGTAISGDNVFLMSSNDDTIYSIDVSDPTNISVIDTFVSPMPSSAIYPGIANGHLLYGYFNSSFYAINIGDPANLSLTGEYTSFPKAFRNRTVSIDKVSFNIGDSLMAMNTADPANIVFSHVFEQTESCRGPFDGFFYCLENERFTVTTKELTVWDYRDPMNPVKRGTVNLTFGATSSTVSDIDYEDGYLYVGAGRLFIVDVRDPDNPAQTYSGTVFVPQSGGGSTEMLARNNKLYATAAQNLVILDVSDKANPTVLSTTNGNQSGSSSFDGIALSDDLKYAYLGSESGDKMAIVDISNTSSPVVRSTVTFANVGRAPNPVFKDNVVYLMAREGSASANYVTSIDVSDPVNPVILDEISKGSSFIDSFYIYGDYLLANINFEIFDISDPANMTLEYTLTDGASYTEQHIGAEGSYGFISNNGIHVYDLGTNFGAGGGGVAAICTEPQAAFASLNYNSTRHVLQVCNGSGWSDLGPDGPGGAGCASPTGQAGSIYYDKGVSNTYKYCDGANWVTFN